MTDVTDADREKAREVVLKWTRTDLDVMTLSEDFAAALAEERAKARAPFVALAEAAEQQPKGYQFVAASLVRRAAEESE